MSIRLLACRLCQRAQLHTRRGHLHGKWCILPLPRHPQVSTRLQALYAAVCSATKEDNIAAASDDDLRAPDLRTVCIVRYSTQEEVRLTFRCSMREEGGCERRRLTEGGGPSKTARVRVH